MIAAMLAWCMLASPPAGADDELDARRHAAFVAAVERVAPSVVRIETVGGREQVEGMLVGPGPTTGLAVDPAGYVVTSAINFVNDPTSILVRLPDGTRKPAKRIATDHARRIVLLKIEPDRPLPTCEIAPQSSMRVGQWAIAVGRTFREDRPNMAVGILSATDRVWGKALQTDAAVSPNNYGGPLIDVTGRVMGVLVPLSPESGDAIAGVEWYDSGIGFAVPAEHVMQVLPRLKQGEDLFPGRLGVALQSENLYADEAVVKSCAPKSPAEAAGLKPGDRLAALNGRPIRRGADLLIELGRRYAGDAVQVAFLRGGKRMECKAVLDRLPPPEKAARPAEKNDQPDGGGADRGR